MKSGVTLIAEERKRQVVYHNWTPEHDDTLTDSELALAAGVYAINAACNVVPIGLIGFDPVFVFPFSREYFKPDTEFANRDQDDAYLRDLIKAGALIAAEIDRVQRKKERSANARSYSRRRV